MRRIRGDVPELSFEQRLELICGLLDEPKVFSAERSDFDSEEQQAGGVVRQPGGNPAGVGRRHRPGPAL